MNGIRRFMACSLTALFALSISCSIQKQIPLAPIAVKTDIVPPELSSQPLQDTGTNAFSSPLPSVLAQKTPLPVETPATISTSVQTPISISTPTPFFTFAPSFEPSIAPSASMSTAAPLVVPTRTPAATRSATFTQSLEDPRFEEYRLPGFSEKKGPPGILSRGGMYGAVYPVQVSVEQQSGDVIVAWRNYDYDHYYTENNIRCYDTPNLKCWEKPGYFSYNPDNDYWQFVKDLNTEVPIPLSTHLWWWLNVFFQKTIDPSLPGYPGYGTGLVIRLDIDRNMFWVYQMNDMPPDVNGGVGLIDDTPGIPYPPVQVKPSSWISSSSPRGFITAQNAFTYSPEGLYFFESELPDYTLRIHYFLFASVPKERRWLVKTFAFKTGPFRSLSIDDVLAPHVVYSKKDAAFYFMSRYWENGMGQALKTLIRVKKSDVH